MTHDGQATSGKNAELGWRLYLLDNFALRGATGEAALSARKAIALIAFLALQRDRTARRDALANMFWGDVDTAQGRVSLRQTLTTIRRVEGQFPIVTTGPDIVSLSGDIDVDVDRFTRMAAGDTADRTAAAEIYRTDLLAGFALRDAPAFNEWLGIAQAHLRQRAVDVLLSLSDDALRPGGDVNAGTTAALRLLAIDPFNEAAHRALMSMYARQGRAALALAQYRGLADLLRRELQVAPDAETQQLYERIGGQRRQLAEAATAKPAVSTPDVGPVDALTLPAPDSASVEPITSSDNRVRWRRFAAISGCVLVCVLGGLMLWRAINQYADRSPIIARVYPIAVAPTDERWPAMSPDGTLLAYTAARDGNVDMYLTSTAGGGETTKLTDDPAVDASPVWRDDGRSIAFIRYERGSQAPCRIMLRPMPVGTEQQIGRCLNTYLTNLAWSNDGKTLYFDDDPDPRAPRRIVALDVATGATRSVTDGGAGASGVHGDYSPKVSHDGTRLVYQRESTSTTDLIVQDLASGRVSVIASGLTKNRDIAWGPDDAGVFYSIEDGPDAGLWWVAAAKDGRRVRLSGGLTAYTALSVSASGKRLAVQVSQNSGRFLKVVPGSDHASEIAENIGLSPNGFDSLMAQAADGTIAFMSTRTGSQQLWRYREGQGLRQLTTSAGIAYSWLSWAPDGRRLAVAATADGRSSILVIDTLRGTTRSIAIDKAANGYPTWSADGRYIYWSALRARGSRLVRIASDLSSPVQTVMEGQFSVTRISADGRSLYFTEEGRTGISRRMLDAGGMPAGPAQTVVPDLSPTTLKLWALTPTSLYFPALDRSGIWRLIRQDLGTGRRQQIDVPTDGQSSLHAYAAAGGGIYLEQTRFQNDITGIDFQ